MANYYTSSFDSVADGASVAGWSNVIGTWQAMSRRPTDGSLAFSSNPGAEGDIALYTGAGTFTDSGIKISSKMVAAEDQVMGMILRSNANATAAYMVWPYNLYGSLYIYVFKRAGAGWSQVGSASGVVKTISAGQTLHVRANIVSQGVNVRVWVNAEAEPSSVTWSSALDASITGAGYNGLWYPSGAASPNQISVDQVELTNTLTYATSLSFSANPASGNVGAASGNFTVATNGALAGTVIVAPSDGGAGGTFTPATLTLNAGTTSASFTYTASSAGSKTISITNDGGLSNPASVSYSAISTAATALSFTANPSTGYTGQASGNFTVAANGTLSASVTVTPSDGGAGGSFTPSTLTLTSGSTSGSFTYTAATSGAKTISLANDGGLTNPSGVAYTASNPPSIVNVDDAALFWSPGNWDLLQSGDIGVASKCRQTALTGAYLKFRFSGCTSLNINFDASTLPSAGLTAPRVRVVLNNKTETIISLTSGVSSYQVSNALSAGTVYDCFVQVVATSEGYGNRFGSAGVSPTNVVRITGVQIGSGGSVQAASLLPNGYGLVWGDSLVEGALTNDSGGYPSDRGRSFGQYIGMALGAEFGCVGFGGQGWGLAGNGAVPAFVSTWDYHSAGRPRSFSGFSWVAVAHGTNGGADAGSVWTWISNCRAAVGAGTWIFVVVPPGGFNKTALTGAVNSYNAANPSDTKVKLIDVSDSMQTSGMDAFYSGTYATTDGIHLRDWAHGFFGAAVARKMQVAMDGAYGGGAGSAVYPTPSQVLSGVTYGPNGNDNSGSVTLPAATNVRSGITYGVGGTGSTGNLTLPTAAQVQTGVQFGANGSQYTGTYAGSGGGSAVFPTAAQVLTGVTFGPNGADYTGTVVLPSAAQVLSGIGFGASGSLSGTITLPTASQVLSSVSFGPGSATAGNVVLPSASNVRSGVQYGVSGTGSTGNVTLPAAGDVRSGTQYGSAGTQYTGTLSTSGGGGTYPAASQVIFGVSYGPSGSDYTGNVTMPSAGQVQAGVGYGAAGTQYVGLLTTGGVVAAGQVPNGRYLRVGA